MLHKEIPFLRIVLPLCAGIISGLYSEPGSVFLIFAFISVSCAFSLSLLFNKYQVNNLYGITLTLSLILCGLLLYTLEKKKISHLNEEKIRLKCTLSDFPEERANSYRMIVRLNSVTGSDGIKPAGGSMLLYLRKGMSAAEFLPGDILIINCLPSKITNRGNPFEFDYRFYMENQGIRYMAYISRNDITGHFIPARRKLVHKALIIREKIIEMYRNRGITGNRLALVAAITVGNKTLLEQEQKQNFIKAGVMHIMAVSGLHAVILSLFVFNLLFFLKRYNIIRVAIALVILWSFAFVTGLTPSVLRATLMFSFIQAGNLMKRPANGINSVLASAFVLILIRPSVIFDAGFLLSYSAVIYIISFYKDLYLMLQFKNQLTDKIWQSVVVTLVAQAGTLPLTIMLFNRFPAYFLLTNIIIVPLSSLLIITGCLLPLLYPVVFLSQFLGAFLNHMTGFTEFLTEKAAALPGSTIENLGMTSLESILLTITIFIFCSITISRYEGLVKYFLLMLLLTALATTYRDISVRTTNELIVYNIPGSTSVGVRTGKTMNLYSGNKTVAPEIIRHCSILGIKIENNLKDSSMSFIRAGDKTILITGKINNTVFSGVVPDIVILKGSKPDISYCRHLRKYPELVIITSEAASRFRIPDNSLFQNIDSLHNTRISGAFVMRL